MGPRSVSGVGSAPGPGAGSPAEPGRVLGSTRGLRHREAPRREESRGAEPFGRRCLWRWGLHAGSFGRRPPWCCWLASGFGGGRPGRRTGWSAFRWRLPARARMPRLRAKGDRSTGCCPPKRCPLPARPLRLGPNPLLPTSPRRGLGPPGPRPDPPAQGLRPRPRGPKGRMKRVPPPNRRAVPPARRPSRGGWVHPAGAPPPNRGLGPTSALWTEPAIGVRIGRPHAAGRAAGLPPNPSKRSLLPTERRRPG
jgi:hypothetical protein